MINNGCCTEGGTINPTISKLYQNPIKPLKLSIKPIHTEFLEVDSVLNEI